MEGITVTPLSTAGEALRELERGAADAALVDVIAAYDYLRGNPALRLAGLPLEPGPYVAAVSVESPILLRNLKETLAELEADGTLASLRVKWMGEAAGE